MRLSPQHQWKIMPLAVHSPRLLHCVIGIVFCSIATAIIIPWGVGSAAIAFVCAAVLGFALVSPPNFLLIGVLFYASSQSVLQQVQPGTDISFSKMFMAGFTGILFMRALIAPAFGQSLPRPKNFHVADLALCAWAGLTATWSLSPEAYPVVFRLLACFGALYFGYWIATTHRLHIELAIGGASIIAGLSCVAWRLATPAQVVLSTSGANRVDGSFGGPVTTATVAMVGLPVFTQWFVQRGNKAWRSAATLGFLSIALALLLTITRTAIVGILLYGLFLFIGSTRRDGRFSARGLPVVVLLVIGILGSLVFVPESDVTRRTMDLPGASSAASLNPNLGSGRVMLWTTTITLLRASTPSQIAFGHGLQMGLNDLFQATMAPIGVHNSFLEILYDMGVVGLLLFLTVTLMLIRSLATRGGDYSAQTTVKRLWLAYFLCYCLSTLMFSGYAYSIGAQWFTYLGLGSALAPWPSRKSTDAPVVLEG